MTQESDSDGLSVLVVEDNHHAADSCATLLSMFGHRVQMAFDGQTALRAAAELQLDVALIDIRLPDIDGYTIAQRLSQQNGHRPLLVAVTGYGAEEDIQRSYLAGFDLHLTKPVDPEALIKLLRRFERVVAPTGAD
jgi:two-component system, OmpR family, response regulator